MIKAVLNSKVTKIVAAVVSVGLVATIAVGATMAYLTDNKTKTNTFTIGNVTIDLQETFDQTKASNLAPGMTVEKKPKVVSTGVNPCWVRVRVTIPEATVNGAKVPAFTLNNPDTTNWVKDGDYYYYKTVVSAANAGNDDETSFLFTGVTLNKDLKEGSITGDVNVIVYAEAVQSQGLTATTAQAAFAEVNK